MSKHLVQTGDAPQAIGTYSQAVRAGDTIYQPYPARAAVGVASLPRGALVEIEAVLVV